MTGSTTNLRLRLNFGEISYDARNKAEPNSEIASPPGKLTSHAKGPRSFAFFGHFDGTNFGNESSLQAILYNLRRFQPDARVTCICSDPQITASTYNVQAVPFSGAPRKRWHPKSRLTKMLRKFCVALGQPLRWLRCMHSLRSVETLIVPGTGLLTDSYGLGGWGPGGLLKWSLLAKARGCKVALVSIGAGPINGTIGKWCTKLILSLAVFRSYRDASTVRYLDKIGLAGDNEAVIPDLAFSLPESVVPRRERAVADNPVVGLGVMVASGVYGDRIATQAAFRKYLDTLVETSIWLLGHGYDIRLLSGDLADWPARRAFMRAIETRLSATDLARIIDEPVNSFADVLAQIASSDLVVATRFHNIVFGFLCGKPLISISFHHKCESLMAMMGMSDYCLEMRGLGVDRLIDALRQLDANAEELRHSIKTRVTAFRETLDRQYEVLFGTAEQSMQAAELIANAGAASFTAGRDAVGSELDGKTGQASDKQIHANARQEHGVLQTASSDRIS